jgi:polyketide biosynthesis enoyl-CoA hydratase PksI
VAEVVHLLRHGSAIAAIEMADREGRNTFTRALVAGLGVASQQIAADKTIKVAVIHGYDSIFCAGGTQEELLTLAEHKVTLDVHDFYRALLDCPVPAIAAMQGHALVFGLYADLVAMAQEAIYSANFMKYGFTPRMGSTLVLPMKFGAVLANEMLFSARGYHGGILRERGIGIPVVPSAETVATALKPAEDLADKPDVSLRLLKQAMTHRLRLDLPDVIAREKAMNEATFAQPDVINRINRRFGR